MLYTRTIIHVVTVIRFSHTFISNTSYKLVFIPIIFTYHTMLNAAIKTIIKASFHVWFSDFDQFYVISLNFNCSLKCIDTFTIIIVASETIFKFSI